MFSKKQTRERVQKEQIRLRQVKIAQYARQIKDQDQLNAILLQVPHRLVRREVYESIKPHLKFESDYPKHVAEPHEHKFVSDGLRGNKEARA